MPARGNAPSLGLFAEFAGAVVASLPRDLDAAVMQRFVEPAGRPHLHDRLQRAFVAPPTSRLVKTLTVTCHGNATATQLRQLGKYDWSNDGITNERFPIQPHNPMTDTLELFQFDHDVSWEEMLAERTRRNLGEPTHEHGLYLGIQHPDEQRAHPIVITHKPVRGPYGCSYVLVLYGNAGDRGLGLHSSFDQWDRDYVFVGVRKAAS